MSPNILSLVGSLPTYPLTLKQAMHEEKFQGSSNQLSKPHPRRQRLISKLGVSHRSLARQWALPTQLEICEPESSGSLPLPPFLLLRPILHSGSSTGWLSFLLPSSVFPFRSPTPSSLPPFLSPPLLHLLLPIPPAPLLTTAYNGSRGSL